MSEATGNKDFRALRAAGHRAGSSFAIGRGFVLARDAIARGLIALRVTPNMLSIAGALFTFGAAACLFLGASESWADGRAAGRWPWPMRGALLLFLSAACDMLDGAVARIGRQATPLGAVLDSSLDRISDLAIFVALAGHFAWVGNLTYAMLAMLALCHSTLISYVKARAETLISDCSVGYWLRGERFAALLIAATAAHMPAVLWQQGVLPMWTVWRRLRWTHDVIAARDHGAAAPEAGPFRDGRRLLAPWRFPRGSLPYDLVTGSNIAWIVFSPLVWSPLYGHSDPLRSWLRG